MRKKRDGGWDGGRRPDPCCNILNYTLSFKRPALERKEEVEVLWVMGTKNGNKRSKDRKIMLVLCYCERFEDGVRPEVWKAGREAGEGTRTDLTGHRSTFLS